jgi:hypothetical protein
MFSLHFTALLLWIGYGHDRAPFIARRFPRPARIGTPLRSSFDFGLGGSAVAGIDRPAMRASIQSRISASTNAMRPGPNGTATGKRPSLRNRRIIG